MTGPSRLLLSLTAVLALSAPAQAANTDAPGALKKQPTTTDAPAPAPAPTADQAPQTQTQTQQTSAAPVQNTKASVPVNKGTVKKLATTTPRQTAAPSTTAAPTTVAPRRRSTTSPTSSAARRQGSSARAAATPSRVRTDSTSSNRAATGRSATTSSHSTPAAGPAPGALGTAAARSHGHSGRAHAAAKPEATKLAKSTAPMTSISRAADRVIEVIPGAVVLALVGLTGLVFLLMLRSWAMERRRRRALGRSYGVTVEALATAIEAKDHTTGGHIERVRRLGLLLAAEIVPREARDPQMAYGFLLHDIGKLAVPDAILRAPGRLTEEEWALMRRHPEEGVRMLATVPFLDRALDVVRHHHERWDGGGYPDGLAGEQIPLWARIFSVVDALDAMTAERPYRPGRRYAAAIEEIKLHAGTQFDPAVVAALEGLDPAAVEPLLEPPQQVEVVHDALSELPLQDPLVAA